ncbi:MAG: hypothetical protein GEU83_09105 [Pseudonocardiaceae bacterium]|nr:hypothetical protein [Pseudonocardiaceae bacterium]
MQQVRAVAGLVLIGLAAVIFAGWSPWSWAVSWPGSAEEQREQLHTDVRTVVLDTGAAGVTIRTRDQTRTSLTTRVDAWAWTRPDPTYRRDGHTLTLTGSGCAVDYELVVPRGTTVEGDTGSGAVTAVGVGAVDIGVGSGDVELAVPAGRYRVDSSGNDEPGDIEVIDDPSARYSLALTTSSGDVTVATR